MLLLHTWLGWPLFGSCVWCFWCFANLFLLFGWLSLTFFISLVSPFLIRVYSTSFFFSQYKNLDFLHYTVLLYYFYISYLVFPAVLHNIVISIVCRFLWVVGVSSLVTSKSWDVLSFFVGPSFCLLCRGITICFSSLFIFWGAIAKRTIENCLTRNVSLAMVIGWRTPTGTSRYWVGTMCLSHIGRM